MFIEIKSNKGFLHIMKDAQLKKIHCAIKHTFKHLLDGNLAPSCVITAHCKAVSN